MVKEILGENATTALAIGYGWKYSRISPQEKPYKRLLRRFLTRERSKKDAPSE